ncbi:MAG: class I SAM-dependent methyltransferase [Pseudomonadota bacterium]
MESEAKISVSQGGVQETLLLPLWGRAFETKQSRPRLIDDKAVEIIDSLDYDFSTIEQTQSLGQHSWVARSIRTDIVAKAFIEKHPKATIVNLGCGMDTTFSRIDNGQITFYELDFPDVIELRKKFYAGNDRHLSIAASLHDTEWFDQINPTDGLLFLAGGVFMYSSESQMKSFFAGIANHFGACEFCFDAMSPLGVKIGKKMVLKKGGMDVFQGSEGWALKSPKTLEQWDKRFRVVSAVPMHQDVKAGVPFKTRVVLSIPDALGVASMVHLRIEANATPA